ncbi:site-2 protease family protein [Streptomyces sp. NPDC050674]|uniref:site-2 protease family protein n=1 Tax=Streptomyces sp. NPDC050674 TaxID=3157216 RepID=UPI003416F3C8
MDESGGRGRPRSGNDESAERHTGTPARAADPTPADEQPTDERRFTPKRATPTADAAESAPAVPTEPAGPRPASARDAHAEPPTSATGEPSDRQPSDAAPDAPGERGVPTEPAAPVRDDRTSVSGEAPVRQPSDASPVRPSPPEAAEAPGVRSPEPDVVPGQPSPDPSPDTPGERGVPTGPHTAPAPAPDEHPAPIRPEHEDGPPPEGDAHPDRAYAGDPHPAPAAERPEANQPHHQPGPAAPAPARSADGKGPAPQRPEPRGGLLMGRPFGVPVYVAPSWFLVAALITWVFGGQLERVLPELGAARYLVSLFFAVAFYASVLVHELAHTVAALRFKLPVRRIQLQFFGGVSEIEKEAETPGREFMLAFVGPLLSLVLSGAFYAAMQAVEPGTVPGVLLAGLMISNLIVAAFNLLPGLPLDGGRMLRAVVWKLTGKPMTGTVAAAWVGRALAVCVLIGLPLLTQSGAFGTDAVDNVGMDTVLDALLAAILAAIIWTGAGNSLRMARLREHLPELRARALTRRAVPVESDTPLSEALRRANAAGARALVVVDADGRPLSLVREAAIAGVPEHRRPWVAVSGLAQDLTDGMRVSAELSGEELLDALRATPATEYLVVEETGEIYGVLSAADVERAFVKAMARPS